MEINKENVLMDFATEIVNSQERDEELTAKIERALQNGDLASEHEARSQLITDKAMRVAFMKAARRWGCMDDLSSAVVAKQEERLGRTDE